MIIEVCADSYEYAEKAEKAGADRIELCKHLHLDGLTPNYKTAKKTIENLNIPVFVLIRPRHGDFNYSEKEFELMKADIVKFKEMGCKGIVSGILNNDNTIDIKRTNELVNLSRPLEFTFHRAFDVVTDPLKELEKLIQLGVERVLTSGQKQKAVKGIELLKELKKNAKDKIIIMPGSGINKLNIMNFRSFNEIHGSFKNEINTNVLL
tara:strand:+ start:2479 stop:3102 length:624 start_codon:yes stop_codon:yes gene_type:complete